MENLGWGFSPTLDSGPVFTCIVTGDPRLPEAAHRFIRRKPRHFAARHLPTVRILFVWRTPGADHLASRYARQRKLDINFVADRSPEILDKLPPEAVLVFQPGGKVSADLIRVARLR
jgi:hypothetical protein